MNRIVLTAIFITTVFSPIAWAEDAATTAASKKRTEAAQKKLDDTRKHIEEKKKELNGSKWELTLNAVGDPKAKEAQDTFTFQDGQFKSDSLSARGFVATNYTISIPSEESAAAVWETMQTGTEGVVFIRGDWEKDKMQGSISEQLEEGKKIREFYFTTASKKSIPPSSADESKPAQGSVPDVKSSNTLVSKEKEAVVSAFKPGTTKEE